MDSWDATTSSPNVKFENSPAESFLSTPGEMYPSLFGSSTQSTVNPLDMMSPQSQEEQTDAAALADLSLPDIEEEEDEENPSSDRKSVKKRKSWGQVLPEPKTNLPPRKRAKTDDEKEQRRVERVLRNRRAAQSSRERKRLEVEALEKRNKQLETALLQARQANLALMEQVHTLQRSSGVAPTPFRTSPTFSQELFSSQGAVVKLEQAQSFEDILSSVSDNTVNPASLSPTLTPVPEAEVEDEPTMDAAPVADVAAPTSPEASHPAVMCSDLQCRSAEVPRWLTSQQASHPALPLIHLLLTSTSTMVSMFQRPLMQIAMSLRAGYSLPPTPAILNTIIWLVTTPLPSPSHKATTSTSSTSTNSSTTSSTGSPAGAQPRTRPSSTLRLKSLRKILTSSPILARPLTDATMAVLRLVSTEGRDVFPGFDGGAEFKAANPWRNGAELPSKEVLFAVLWTIKVEERRMEIRNRLASDPGRQSVPKSLTPTLKNKNQTFVLKVLPNKRSRMGREHFPGMVDMKRRRLG